LFRIERKPRFLQIISTNLGRPAECIKRYLRHDRTSSARLQKVRFLDLDKPSGWMACFDSGLPIKRSIMPFEGLSEKCAYCSRKKKKKGVEVQAAAIGRTIFLLRPIFSKLRNLIRAIEVRLRSSGRFLFLPPRPPVWLF
jgi:hypothetical protein